MAERVPYLELTLAEREAIHTWLQAHRVDHNRVPVDAQFDHDPATGEWRIPVFWTDARGRIRIDPATGDVRVLVVRRRELWPLPWPKIALRFGGPVTHISVGGVDLTPYVRDVTICGQTLPVRAPAGADKAAAS